MNPGCDSLAVMNVIRELQRRSKQVFLPAIGVCLIGYFIYHAVQGDRGLLAYYQLGQAVNRAEHTLTTLRGERTQLAHRVSLLRPDNLDPDMLEERARVVLNMVRENEFVILVPRSAAPQQP